MSEIGIHIGNAVPVELGRVLWGPSKLEQMYHLVQEVNENAAN